MFRNLIALMLLTLSLCGEIVEVKHFSELKRFLDPHALVVFDIDNTLITPIQEVGTDQWFHHRWDWYEMQGCSHAEALEHALSEWEAIQNITKVMTVERSTADIVKEVQKTHRVMGLSTRGLALATRTIHQLKEVGIFLGDESTLTQDEVPLLNPHAILFRRGVLFTAGTHKGQALLKLLERVQYLPHKIVFINDKSTNLREVEVACQEKGILFTGLRYGFLDDKVKSFRPDIARVQFEHFKMILSDKEAQCLVGR